MGVFICPICRGALSNESGVMRCALGHSYDVARSGYVNLHRPGIKSNSRSGDPEDMVRARRAFLSRGFYDRYVRSAANFAAGAITGGARTVVDAACGEGHHTLILADSFAAELTVGIDASKTAADLAQKTANAAKRERDASGVGTPGDVRFIAGNIFDMPLCDSAADVVSVLFAPIPFEEARRVLRPGGALLVCSAGREHLIELRRLVYDEVRYKDEKPPEADGFDLAARDNVSYSVDLDKGSLGELFAMTPFCRRVGGAARERVAAANGSPMTVSVDLSVYIKK